MRKLLTEDPCIDRSKFLHEESPWDAKWIAHPEFGGEESAVTAYRNRFKLDSAKKQTIHVSADQRYELFLDGQRIGRGPERGDQENWFYETYELDLQPGEHTLVARTWWLAPNAPPPYAQMTMRPGFFLMGDCGKDDRLSTGIAKWQVKQLGGYKFVPPQMRNGFQVTGAKVHLDGSKFDWGFEEGKGDGWIDAKVVRPAAVASLINEPIPYWMMRPAMLPQMMEQPLHIGEPKNVAAVPDGDIRAVPVRAADNIKGELADWAKFLQGKSPITIPAKAKRRVIVDLGNYYCAYPRLTTTGGAGATISIFWAEGLYNEKEGHTKGNRDEIENKYFLGIGDTFDIAGGDKQLYEPLWWEAGRWVEIIVSTKDQPLTLNALQFNETHFPHKFEQKFESADPRLAKIIPPALRTLEMCSHETYFDCPYYEQLMYVGDTRLQVLVTYATTRDDHLPRKAMYMFDQSRLNWGMTQSRYPSHIRQVIPPFSLYWIGMLHDYSMWRDDLAFVKARMPGVRAVLDAFRKYINKDNLLTAPDGWNFVDWVPGWYHGTAPDAQHGINGTLNFHFAWTLRHAAELEDLVGEPELAARNRKTADAIATAASKAFWDEKRGLFSEDLKHEHFSEHTQCMALLSDSIPEGKQSQVVDHLFKEDNLYRTTIYFLHYLFEVCQRTGHMDKFFERMQLWFDLEKQGFKTMVESPEPSRSDCHAWGAHPVYHYFATVLGIRPSAPGFKKVRIQPQLGQLDSASGTMVHPRGLIRMSITADPDKFSGEIELPEGVSGELIVNDRSIPLKSGKQTF
jgi:hypothetical protein